MKNKIFLAAFLLLLGCDSLDRLTGNPVHHDTPPVANTTQPVVYEGNFRGANFVEINLDGVSELSVYISRKGKWMTVDPYDPDHKTKAPYYLTSENTIIFFNTTPDDLYSIKVKK